MTLNAISFLAFFCFFVFVLLVVVEGREKLNTTISGQSLACR